MMNNPFFWMELVGEDKDAVCAAWNMGIDSRLEAFTKSTHVWMVYTPSKGFAMADYEKMAIEDKVKWGPVISVKLKIEVADHHEFQTLVRRLLEISEDDRYPEEISESAAGLADDLVSIQYDVEVL